VANAEQRKFRRPAYRHLAALILVACGAFGLWLTASAQVEADTRVVYVAPIDGVIDLGLAPFVRRLLEEADEAGAAAVVLEINTFGGRVDAAVQIRDALLTAPVPTVAFINKRAISAGALIALASEKIAMAGGSTIGAATPVQIGQSGAAQPVEEKTVSYVRKEFRATAEGRKRPPLIAEAMVDADVAIPDLDEKGKLLTLTTDEALKHGIADFRADTLEDVLAKMDLAGAEVRTSTTNWAENVVRFLTHPIVSSLLITLGMLGIIIELRTPGIGLPGALGVVCLASFFWGHWLVQLAGWEEMLLVLAGLALVLVELFIIPGFGIAGILGIAALGAGLVLSLTGDGDTATFIVKAASRVVFSLLAALGISLVVLRFLPHLPLTRRLVLETGLDADSGYASAPESDMRWRGKRGIAQSQLRPAGIARIEGERVDVVSDGELIEPGAAIEVTRVDGNRIVVRRTTPIPNEE
jgi:membrane-bound serine protease (ClpP class)